MNFDLVGAIGIYSVRDALTADEIARVNRDYDVSPRDGERVDMGSCAVVQKRLEAIARKINEKFFQYDIDGPLEIEHREAGPRGPTKAKMDWIEDRRRKLTLIVPIDAQGQGGEVILLTNNPCPVYLPNAPGTLTVFASIVCWRVAPVETRQRMIVGRAYGLNPIR